MAVEFRVMEGYHGWSKSWWKYKKKMTWRWGRSGGGRGGICGRRIDGLVDVRVVNGCLGGAKGGGG